MADNSLGAKVGSPVVQTVIVKEYVYNTSSSTSASDSTSFATGDTGALIRSITATLTRTVQFSDAMQTGDSVFLEFSDNQVAWLSIGTLSYVNNQGVIPLITENSTSYGVGVDFVSNTQLAVTFGQYANMFGKTTVGGAGQAWSIGAGAGYWRVRRDRVTSVAYGAGLATSVKAGLVTPRKGQTDLTISCAQAGFAKTRAQGIYYQDQDGNHRLKFNLAGSFTSASVTSLAVSVTGVVFKTGVAQAVSAYIGASGAAGLQSAATSSGTSNLTVNYAASLTGATSVGISGDVELDAKPSWA